MSTHTTAANSACYVPKEDAQRKQNCMGGEKGMESFSDQNNTYSRQVTCALLYRNANKLHPQTNPSAALIPCVFTAGALMSHGLCDLDPFKSTSHSKTMGVMSQRDAEGKVRKCQESKQETERHTQGVDHGSTTYAWHCITCMGLHHIPKHEHCPSPPFSKRMRKAPNPSRVASLPIGLSHTHSVLLSVLRYSVCCKET
jgi:hypothetical protein